MSGLESGSGFLLTIYSGNSRGRSKTVVNLEVELPSLPVKQLETRHDTGEWDTGEWDTGDWDTGEWDIGEWDTGE